MLRLIASLKQKRWINIFVIYLRYLIGAAFVLSSLPKIADERFTTANGEFEPINSWIHFFETLYRTGLYWEFLGWAQLLAGFILMTQRFATFGAIIFLPLILNIFVITISLNFSGTPFITGLMLLATIFLLLWDYNKLSFLLQPDGKNNIIIISQHDPFSNNIFWTYLGVLLFATTILFGIFLHGNAVLWFIVCVTEGFVGLISFSIYLKRKS